MLISAAGVFFLLGNTDGVFISLVLGSLAFFLSVRTQVKGRLAEREAERMAQEESEAARNPVDEAIEEEAEPEGAVSASD